MKKVEGSGGDKGIDSYTGDIQKPEIIFQFKHFSGGNLSESNRKPKILKDIEKSSKLNPKKWILCISLSLSIHDHRWLQENLNQKYPNIEIKVIEKSELQYYALQPETKEQLMTEFAVLYEYQNIINEIKENQLILNLLDKGFTIYNKNEIDSGEANDEKSCWETGYFDLKDINRGFDLRRKIIEDIIYEIRVNKTNGIILSGNPCSGKTIISKRLMIELGNDKFIAFYCESPPDIKASSLKNTFSFILDKYKDLDIPIILIVDNFHTQNALEIIKFYNDYTLPNLFFLFATSENDYKKFQKSLDRDGFNMVERANKKLKKIEIQLTEIDCQNFFLKMANIYGRKTKSENIEEFIKQVITTSRNDLLVFLCSLRELVSKQGKPNFDIKSYEKCLESDFNSYVNILNKYALWNESISSLLLSALGIKITDETATLLGLNKSKLNDLVSRNFLVIDDKGFKRSRHESWATGFLNFVIKDYFSSDINNFIEQHSLDKHIHKLIDTMKKEELVIMLERGGIISKEEFELGKVLINNINDEAYSKFSNEDKSDIYCFGLAKFFMELNEIEKSISVFERSLELNPNNFAALNNLGNLYENTMRYDKAIECYNLAKSKNPKSADPDYNIAQIKLIQGYLDQALDHIDLSILNDTNPLSSYAVKGNILTQLRRLPEAEEYYKKVLENDKNNNLAILGLGNTSFYKLIEKYPQINRNLVHFIDCEDIGIISTLLTYYTNYIQIYPYDKEGYYNLGKSQTLLGFYMLSIENLANALKIEPYNMDILLSQMNNYSFISDHENMQIYLNKILEIDPYNIIALRNSHLLANSKHMFLLN